MNNFNNRYDLVVVGGGISGLGAAQAAVQHGFRTLIIERGICGAATSAQSLRIIHGGFRYLQTLDLPRVRESNRDQTWLLQHKAKFIRPLACLMPLERWGVRSAIPLRCASLAFGLLRDAKNELPLPQVVDAQVLKPHCPLIEPVSRHKVLRWYDALLESPDDLISDLRKDFQSIGGEVLENRNVTEITDGQSEVIVRTTTNNDSCEFISKAVVIATGPWLHSLGGENLESPRGWCVGFNIVLRSSFESFYAIGLRSHTGRLFFLVPRVEGGKQVSVLGTGYVACQGGSDHPEVAQKDVDSFIEDFKSLVPEVSISPNDVSRIEAGILPMQSNGVRGPQLYGASRTYRSGRVLRIMSTKYTTFRSQGEQAIGMLKKAGII